MKLLWIMGAKRARKLTVRKQREAVRSLLQTAIKDAADNGLFYHYEKHLAPELMEELRRKKYTVEIIENPYGEKFHKISWRDPK